MVEAYLFPTVDENREKFTWGQPDVESIFSFCSLLKKIVLICCPLKKSYFVLFYLLIIFSYGPFSLLGIREYAKKTLGWTNKRTDEIILPVIKRLNEKKSQKSIENYFKITGVTSRTDLKVSKRVRTALNQMSGDLTEEVMEGKKTKKRSSKDTKKAATLKNDNNGEFDKPKRKRKAKTTLDDIDEPSTSTTTKKVVLPDNNEPIPQREKDKEIMESNKLKAIQTLKGAKK